VLPASRLPLVERYRTALLDLDGVVYRGAVGLPHAADALAESRRRGLRAVFVTNNASRTPEEVASLLTGLGVAATGGDVLTSAQAAARLAARTVPAGSRVLVVGGHPVDQALREHGLTPVRSAADGPAAVVQGFAPEVGWRQLAEASYAVARGVPWIVSNMDTAVPREGGVAPGNGALVGVVSVVTGRTPLVAGKPCRPILDEARRRGPGPHLVVGDGLGTDIRGANGCGCDSLLVLSGVTTLPDLLAAPAEQRPTYLAADLGGLLRHHPAVDVDGDHLRCGGWRARITGHRLALTGPDTTREDLVDGARLLCAAAWQVLDGGRRLELAGPAREWSRRWAVVGS
jgi:HAD superfamily hydrolase (TIGR01450 family)